MAVEFNDKQLHIIDVSVMEQVKNPHRVTDIQWEDEYVGDLVPFSELSENNQQIVSPQKYKKLKAKKKKRR